MSWDDPTIAPRVTRHRFHRGTRVLFDPLYSGTPMIFFVVQRLAGEDPVLCLATEMYHSAQHTVPASRVLKLGEGRQAGEWRYHLEQHRELFILGEDKSRDDPFAMAADPDGPFLLWASEGDLRR